MEEQPSSGTKRIHHIDFVRGLVIIIMALDHIRDLMHTTSITNQPTDLATTTPALFFTRWITHLCAPTFVFLSGTSVFLSMQNKNDRTATRRFLLTRGLWLILLEFTLVNFGIWFDVHFSVLFFEVIAAIGLSFVVLSLMLGLSSRTIGLTGLAILFLHNLAPLVPGSESSWFKQVLMPLFSTAAYPLPGGRLFVMGYPPIPWLGIMLVGFATGRFFNFEVRRQRSLFLRLGLGAIALFIVLRWINRYGDPIPWSHQKNGTYTILSFLNLAKYPPSLDYCLMFLGLMFLILSAAVVRSRAWMNVFSVYGRVPLFFFLVHWYIIHPLMFGMVYAQGFKSSDLIFGFNLGRPKSGSGLELWAIYLVWIGVVVALYPVCKWYGRYKVTNRTAKKCLRYL